MKRYIKSADNWRDDYQLARKTSDPEVLAKLADNENSDVRERVAENPSTPLEALAKLANDARWDIRQNVVRNPSVSSELLAKLANDEIRMVRHAVAKNPSTPPEVLAKLANDEEVVYDVAKNPSTPPEVLAKLATDADQYTRRFALQNPSTPSITRRTSKNSNKVSRQSPSALKKLFEAKSICDSAMDYINDSDPNWEYDSAESFSNACLDWIYNNLDLISDICDTDITSDDIAKISDWILDECSHGEFGDASDEDSYYGASPLDWMDDRY